MDAFQDHDPEHVAHGYGSGRLNPQGLQIKSAWEGEEAVTRSHPQAVSHGGSRLRLRWVDRLADCHGAGAVTARGAEVVAPTPEDFATRPR